MHVDIAKWLLFPLSLGNELWPLLMMI